MRASVGRCLSVAIAAVVLAAAPWWCAAAAQGTAVTGTLVVLNKGAATASLIDLATGQA